MSPTAHFSLPGPRETVAVVTTPWLSELRTAKPLGSLTAPLEVTLERLAGRRSRKVPVSRQETRWIHKEATRRAAGRSFAAIIDTFATPDPSKVDHLVTLLR